MYIYCIIYMCYSSICLSIFSISIYLYVLLLLFRLKLVVDLAGSFSLHRNMRFRQLNKKTKIGDFGYG